MSAGTSEQLVPTALLPPTARPLFPYQRLNAMQSACFETAFSSDQSLLVAAPTGSGKTGVLELAIARLWASTAPGNRRPAAVYVAPLKALVNERFLDWKAKSSCLGAVVVELTGDTDDEDADERAVAAADLIVTTPEKWDSFTRFRRNAQGVLGRVALLLIDEIHLLNDPKRGPTLESVVSRMRTISLSPRVRAAGLPIARLRIVGASATISNTEDIAEWLSPGCVFKKFDERFRPVPLRWKVLSYPMRTNLYMYDQQLSSQVYQVVRSYSGGRPSLVFTNSRKQAEKCVPPAARALSWCWRGGRCRRDCARAPRARSLDMHAPVTPGAERRR